jgi:hypothetical protein
VGVARIERARGPGRIHIFVCAGGWAFRVEIPNVTGGQGPSPEILGGVHMQASSGGNQLYNPRARTQHPNFVLLLIGNFPGGNPDADPEPEFRAASHRGFPGGNPLCDPRTRTRRLNSVVLQIGDFQVEIPYVTQGQGPGT